MRAVASDTDVLVLPGVGAFGGGRGRGSRRAARRCAQAILGGLPTIGICLGMQLLFDASDEGAGRGLGVIAGRVTKLHAAARAADRLEHRGAGGERPAVRRGAAARCAYYANSYVCRPADAGVVTAWTEHEGDRFPAAVRAGRAVGVQFHPRRAPRHGVRFLRAFLDAARNTGDSE